MIALFFTGLLSLIFVALGAVFYICKHYDTNNTKET